MNRPGSDASLLYGKSLSPTLIPVKALISIPIKALISIPVSQEPCRLLLFRHRTTSCRHYYSGRAPHPALSTFPDVAHVPLISISIVHHPLPIFRTCRNDPSISIPASQEPCSHSYFNNAGPTYIPVSPVPQPQTKAAGMAYLCGIRPQAAGRWLHIVYAMRARV